MLKSPLDLAKARILVTNDDGINAPGLKILEKVGAQPVEGRLGGGAGGRAERGGPFADPAPAPAGARISARRFAVDGTPTDCVLLAVNHLIPERRPDLVLSGVNRGANLGEDVTYSGTIAAAMEAHAAGHPLDRPQPAARRAQSSAGRRGRAVRRRGHPQAGLGRLAATAC